MKNGQNVIAIALCIIFAASIAGIYIYEKNRQAHLEADYWEILPLQEEQRKEQERLKEEHERLREEARQKYAAAVEEYLPGMAFCGDSVMSDTGGGGMDFRSTVNSLVRANVCNSPTVFINVTNTPSVDEKYAEYLPIIFVGADISLGDIDGLKSLISRYVGANDRYIVVGPTTGSQGDMSYLEYVLSGAYGDHFINIREYMSSAEPGEGLSSLELEITPEDRTAMEQGRIPPSLLKSDGVHLNDNGTRLLSYLTYSRMEELGYFDEILSAKQIYEEAEGNE